MNHLVRITLNFIKYLFLFLLTVYLIFSLKIIYDKRNEDISLGEKVADGFIGGLYAGIIYIAQLITYIFYPNYYRSEDWKNIS